MKITNKLNLPEPLLRAVTHDDYRRSGEPEYDYSVTGLIRPARIARLLEQHGDEIEVDASDEIFALFGRAIHSILEHSADAAKFIVEKRFVIERHGFKIAGRFDIYYREEMKLQDWKWCGVMTTRDGVKPEWEAQANLNRLILEENGVKVNALQIVAIYRDWMKRKAQNDLTYPQQHAEVFPVKLWPREATESYLTHRIAAHEAAKDSLPMCDPVERWSKPEKWALMRYGRKSALKLFETQEQAEAGLMNAPAKPGAKYYVEHRPGEETRCLHYCRARSVCSFALGLSMPHAGASPASSGPPSRAKQPEESAALLEASRDVAPGPKWTYDTIPLDPGDRTGAFRND